MTKSFSNEKKHHRQTMMIMEWQSKEKKILSFPWLYGRNASIVWMRRRWPPITHTHTQHVAKHLLPNAFYILWIFSNQLLIHHFYFYLLNKFCQIQPTNQTTNHLHNNFHCILVDLPVAILSHPVVHLLHFLIILVCLFDCLLTFDI